MTIEEGELRRVARQLNLITAAQQERLHAARVLVIGAGGLGCPLMQSLAAVGVGHIRLLDDDTVDLTNIHRQVLFGAGDVGRPKVEVAAERLTALQPGIVVEAAQTRLTTDNALAECEAADLVIDGSDTFATKYLSADACEATGTPLVWGTVLRFAGQAALWHSGPGGGADRGVGLRDFFPEQPDAAFAPDCATAGVLGATTAVVGNLMATEAVKYLAGLTRPDGEPASVAGRVLNYDALTGTVRALTVRADAAREPVTGLRDFYGAACAASIDDVAFDPERAEARRLLEEVRAGKAVAVDVREPHEVLVEDLDCESVKLPLSQLNPDALAEAVGQAQKVVVYCASGVRSGMVVDNVELDGVEIVSLPGGTAAQR
ncbi:ThiF family adenylyltransferase [Corynebacterium frankenforstense]|uniref:ThiF family adenylyltransferase n=1 Tax=Corynebacterium frankenforstense TaxID=1230998 RepID=UPI0026EFB42D|nr:ThiF family adenylyltransferase [Corynebacterium frankenforstense]